MKKTFLVLMLSLLMCCTCFLTGCELFTRNIYAYLNREIVVIDFKDGTDKKVINMKDFLIAYNNYGADLVENNSYSLEDAKDATVQALINQEVMLHEAKKNVTLMNYDKNEIWKSTYDAFMKNLKEYETEVMADWDLSTPTNPSQTSDDTSVVWNAYTPLARVKLIGNEYRIVLSEESDATKDNSDPKTLQTMRTVIYDETGTNDIKQEALKRYVKRLKENEEGQRLSTDNDSVLLRELERIHENYETNTYITKLQNYYQLGDAEGANGERVSSVLVEEVLQSYREKMLISKMLYEANSTTYSENMLSAFDSVNYVVDDNYFFVAHILIKYDEEQQAEYDGLKDKMASGEISPAVYTERLNALQDGLTAQVRDSEGKILENTNTSANDVLDELRSRLAEVPENATDRNDQLDEIFKDYLYKYNEDDGIMNADYLYVIGTEDSKMVESFTQASRELNTAGNYGAISELIPSEYGAHIIYYAGKVTNLFTIPTDTEFLLSSADILKLANKKLNTLSNKTVFDKIYEELASDNYSSFSSAQIRTLKSKYEIVINKANIDRA